MSRKILSLQNALYSLIVIIVLVTGLSMPSQHASAPHHEFPHGKGNPAETVGARFGIATTSNYKKTFFTANPGLEGQVVVHHAVEQQMT